MTKRWRIIGAAIIVIICVCWRYLHYFDTNKEIAITNPELTVTEQQKIIVDPAEHRITVINRQGRRTMILPPSHPVAITEGNDGKITVTKRRWGTELSPYIGAGYSDHFRLVGGLSIFYWDNLALISGLSVCPRSTLALRGFVGGAYSVFSNTSLFVGFDTNRDVIGGLSWRL